MVTKVAKVHILVVDDESIICRSLSVMLRREGFAVTTVECGRDALDMISADPTKFDMLITDIQMQEFSGIDLMEAIKGLNVEFPILPMTGYADKHNLERMRRAGCRDILVKPFDHETLIRMVRRMLSQADDDLSLSDQIEATAQHFVMADLKSTDDLQYLTDKIDKILRALDEDDVSQEAPVLAEAEVLEACREGAAEALRLLPKAFSGDTEGTSVDLLGRSLATLQAVVCQGRASDCSHFPNWDKGPAVDEDLRLLFSQQQEEWLENVRAELGSVTDALDEAAVEKLHVLFHRHVSNARAIGYQMIEDVCRRTMEALDEFGVAVHADDLLPLVDWLAAAGVHACEDITQDLPQDLLDGLRENAADAIVAEAENEQLIDLPADPGSSRADVVNCQVPLDSIQIEDLELGAAFVIEAREYFEASDENLLILEREPENTEALAVVMRTVHTLKGICGFLDIQPIEALAHAIEELLETVKAGEEQFSGDLNDLVFRSYDLLKELVGDVDQALSGDHVYHPRQSIRPALQDIAEFLQVGASPTTPKLISNKTPEARDNGEAAAKTTDNSIRPGAARIDSDKIDLLLDTIGELVIAESIVEKDLEIRQLKSVRTSRNIAHLGKITRQLQDIGLAMRMVPIRSTFRKMARLIRDLTRKSGKQVDFVTEGEDTQIDREMVDKLIEPLVHLLRNAVDHGIEGDPETRLQHGKPATGTVRLRAYHSGGNIHIRIEDDGRGLNRDAIAAKAVERGLIQSTESLSDSDVFSFIFEAGLSTAPKLTSVSGRGVGMDVVKSQLERLHGKILVDSLSGKGTTFTLVLPLTTAIIDGMIIGVGSQQYILPVLSIIESFRPTHEQVSLVVGRGEIIRFRGNMLPLFRLSRLFEISDAMTDLEDGIAIVVEDSGRHTVLLVDQLVGQQQTVIKTLGGALPNTVGVSGVSIMADGTPGLILDISGIVQLAMNGCENSQTK